MLEMLASEQARNEIEMNLFLRKGHAATNWRIKFAP
jgi:hypothetical protein